MDVRSAHSRECGELFDALRALREAVAEEGREQLERWRPRLVRDEYEVSALNLAHYLALRRRDLVALQERLMVFGLSSLGRCESRVLANLDAVLDTLAWKAGRSVPSHIVAPEPEEFFLGTRLLQKNATALFGARHGERSISIMATMAGDLADDYERVLALVRAGVDVARINCSKDSPPVWRAIVENVRRASRECGRSMKIVFDLCGPRSRTGEVWVRDARRAKTGDRILLVNEGPTAHQDYDFVVQSSLPEATDQLVHGAVVTFDEGSLRTEVETLMPGARGLRVVETGHKGFLLRPNKGLNFPGSDLVLDPLTAKDRADLDAIMPLADIVGYSFVQSASDIERLQWELDERRTGRAEPIGIVAKIETGLAIKNLPEIIVQGAGRGPFGVMIARGDLAVEIGYRRLAELQEELLWLCEASHVPVIWATEVMSSTVKTGRPTRSEMTDAAMAERAECVMLNRGPYLARAVHKLDGLLMRMEGHQNKKVSRLRALKSW